MPITGSWKERVSIESGAAKWGTGWNPIHAVSTEGAPLRNGATLTLTDGDRGEVISEELSRYGWATEDESSALYGYNVETGTADRAPIGVDETLTRDNVDGFPAWGPYANGVPGGSGVRSEDHGSELTITTKEQPDEDAAQGWINKDTSHVLDARTSDPSQYEMQTSMMQRDQTREGSQRGSGSQSPYSAPIKSRIPGMRLKIWAALDSVRHYDMFPYQQEEKVRPFWTRSAATGYPSWLAPNEMYVSSPYNRDPVDNPYTGPSIPSEASPSTDTYGYTNEDVIPYA